MIQIPAGVLGKRAGYTLLNEQRLHKQLSEDGKDAGANDAIYSLYLELAETIDSTKNWEMYFYNLNKFFNISVIIEKKIKSKVYDVIIYSDRVLRNAKQIYSQ